MFRFFKELFNPTTRRMKKQASTGDVSAPDTILTGIVWTFNRKPYDSRLEFDEEVARYQKDIFRERANWKGSEIVIDVPEIEICYEAWIRDMEDLKSNEELAAEERKALRENHGEDGFFQVEISAVLQAANGTSFTALDLMYQMEHQVSNKELGDHVFFEGFRRVREYQGSFPLYHMYCGS